MSGKILEQYNCDRGNVRLLGDGTEFFVLVEVFANPTTNTTAMRRWLRFSSFNAAAIQYTRYWNAFNGIGGICRGAAPKKCKCTFGGNKRMCSPDCCPDNLGGAAYWEIFGNACLYRAAIRRRGRPPKSR